MRHVTPFRLATYLLLLYCLAHTKGGMFSHDSLGFAANSVFAAMKRVTFDFNGSQATWYGFWMGFGLFTSLFLLFSAWVAWCLDKAQGAQWAFAAPIAWGLLASQVGNAILAWKYFFAGPGIMAVVVCALLAWGILQKSRA